MLGIMRIIIPALVRKLNLIDLTRNDLFGIINRDVSSVPRPSIKFMKNYFQNRLVFGAEIGVQYGLNAKSILKELNIKKMYLIDIWENYESYKETYKKFKKDNRIRLIIDYSEFAVSYIINNSLDFVYIDADHEYKSVYQDIKIWIKKVKKGGIVAGHDIFNCSGVLEAVKDFCCENKINFKIELPDWYFIKTKEVN